MGKIKKIINFAGFNKKFRLRLIGIIVSLIIYGVQLNFVLMRLWIFRVNLGFWVFIEIFIMFFIIFQIYRAFNLLKREEFRAETLKEMLNFDINFLKQLKNIRKKKELLEGKLSQLENYNDLKFKLKLLIEKYEEINNLESKLLNSYTEKAFFKFKELISDNISQFNSQYEQIESKINDENEIDLPM